eukprot:scaffold2995_cov120-Isochrysis_galbana.AAC.6
MLRVAEGVGATLGWEVCGPGSARVSQWRFLTRAGGGACGGRPPGGCQSRTTVERADMWFHPHKKGPHTPAQGGGFVGGVARRSVWRFVDTRPRGPGARVSQWRFLTRAGRGRAAAGGPPKGPPHASQPMIRVAGGVGATLGWRARGGERACGGERARVTMAVSDTRAPGGRAAAG